MLPTCPFSKDPALTLMLAHVSEWLLILREHNVLEEVTASLYDGTSWWTWLHALQDEADQREWLCEVHDDPPDSFMPQLEVTITLKADISLLEFIRVLYLLRHLRFEMHVHVTTNLSAREQMCIDVFYCEGVEFERELNWLRCL